MPLQPLGRMVLDRNAENFFAETEQVAFHPGHVVPGIDFTNDPLLQGRLFSYTDTQLLRLGGANFHEIPINRPKCPMRNFQRDGVRRMDVNPGQVAYEPNSLAPDSPREDPRRGFTSHPALDAGDKLRARSETFADHYSQPRLFFRSMSEPEQRHIVGAFTFELSKVSTVAIRRRMLGHLAIIDDGSVPACGCRARHGGPGRDDPPRASADRHETVAGAEPGQEVRRDTRRPQDRRAGYRRHGRSICRRVEERRRKGRRPAASGRAEDRRRHAGQRQVSASRPSARRRTVHPLRCRRRCGIGGRSGDATEGGGRDRLAARRVRPPQGDWDRGHRRSLARRSRDRTPMRAS